MKHLAIIPARGGSRRIPHKNIRDFLGKPIIAYSIEVALGCGLFDEVMVSTDDEEIAQVAKHYGAMVPFLRSAKNANDYASTADVLVEVLERYRAEGLNFAYACCIYPTAPLLTSGALKEAYDCLVRESFNTVFPVVSFGYPIWRSLNITAQGKAEMFWPENQVKRSQDLPRAWHDAGQFYWLRSDAFLKEPQLFSSNSGVIELSESEVQDIDTLVDWQLAELKVRLRDQEGSRVDHRSNSKVE